MAGGVIFSNGTIAGTGHWQVGVRCVAASNNCIDILFENDAKLPPTQNAKGWTVYISTGIYCRAYVSGAYGSYSKICDISLPALSNWVTMDFNFDTNKVTCYRNGVNFGTADISHLNGANIRCIIQNYYSSPSSPRGDAWFQDGSPENPIAYIARSGDFK